MQLVDIFKLKHKTVSHDRTVDNVDVVNSIIKLLTTLGAPEISIADKKARAIIEVSANKHGGNADLQELYLEAVRLVEPLKLQNKRGF